ncbi:hypothetical protein MMPV_000647 [Pyropia vietnamensis]
MVRISATLLAVAVALVAAAALMANPAAAADCDAPFNLALVGRTFTTDASNSCRGGSKAAARFATITATSISYDLSTAKGVAISSTTLTYGRDWVKPTITYTAKDVTTTVEPWGKGRALFVSGLSRLIVELEAMGGSCAANADVWQVVSYLRVLAYEYQLPSNVCLATK